MELQEKLEEQLFSLMQNFNFEKAENFSLRILEKKPNNPLANLVLKSNFNIKSFFEITFISFNYSIVTNYFKTHCGKINLDVCLYFVDLTLKNEGSSFNNQELLNNIFTNVESLEIDKNEIIKFYKNVFDLISLNKTNIQTLREEGKKLKKAAWANILLTQTAGVSATINYEGKKALEVADSVESATKDVEAIVKNFIITESVFKDDLNRLCWYILVFS